MRAAYHLAFLVFSLGTVAAPNMVPDATDSTTSRAFSGQHNMILAAARTIAWEFLTAAAQAQEGLSPDPAERGTSLGETLPEEIELYSIPRHETYRYAIVDHHRVIVDAASRKVVYIVP